MTKRHQQPAEPALPPPARAVAYCRVSSEEQYRHGASLPQQEAACRDYCAHSGLEVAAVLRDEGYSAISPLPDRPAGRQLTGLLAEGAASHVVAISQSRVFRDGEEALRAVRVWWGVGIRLHLLDSGGVVDLDQRGTWLTYGVRALVDQEEREETARRVKRVHRHLLAQGRWISRAPFGYRVVDKVLSVDEAEAAIIREVFGRFAAGEPSYAIQQDLSARLGRPIRHGHLGPWLCNPLYTGRMVWDGEEYPGTHEPIIDPDLWARVQARLAALRATGEDVRGHTRRMHEEDEERVAVEGHRRARQPSSLVSLLRCGLCGSCMQRVGGGGSPSNYQCVAAAVRAVDHAPVTSQQPKCDAALLRQWELTLTDTGTRQAIRDAARRLAHDDRRAPLEARLADIDAQLSRAVALARDGMPAEVIMRSNAPLLEERQALQAQLSAMEVGGTVREVRDLLAVRPATLVRAVREAPIGDQVQALRAVFERVEVLPGRRLVFCYVGGLLEPVERVLPRYWSVKRGITELGW